MKRILSWLLILMFCSGAAAFADQIPKMEKEELKSLLGSENLVILDVRQGRDWSTSEFKIADAVRVDDDVLSVAGNYPRDSTFVLYCAWPNEATSAGQAQKLRDQGYENVYALKGGWQEWFRAKYPVTEKQ